MESLDKMQRAKELPPKDEFFSKLVDSHISEEDYMHAKEVFKEFKCKSMLDYLLLYVRLDVALLGDVLFAFRNLMHRDFSLDPLWYISLPAFAFSAMLKITDIELEPITCPDMHLFLSANIRGGFSFIHKRKAEMCEASGELTNYINYLDANNLYGWAQSQFMPVRDFKFMEKKDINVVFAK